MLKETGLLTTLLSLVYLGFAEWLSRGALSQIPPCIVVSKNQPSNYQANQEACAPFSEGVIRFFGFLWDHTDHNSITAFSTVLIAVFTWTLWRSTYKLWRAGAETAQHQLRAYIGLLDASPCPGINTGGLVTIRIRFKNFGQTPAYDVLSWAAIDVFESETLGTFDQRLSTPARLVAHPSQDFFIEQCVEVSQVERNIEALKKQKMFVYLWGEVTYTDAFKCRRYTKFQLHLPGGRIAEGQWANCEHGNKAN